MQHAIIVINTRHLRKRDRNLRALLTDIIRGGLIDTEWMCPEGEAHCIHCISDGFSCKPCCIDRKRSTEDNDKPFEVI